MPPKKKGEVEEKMVLIGRMGTNLKVEQWLISPVFKTFLIRIFRLV